MAVPGYACLVRKSGTSTGITVEPLSIKTTPATNSTVFRITDSARRVIDPLTAFHFKNGAATIAYTDIAAVDFVFGELTLNAPVAAGSATSLSFSGSYLPITTSSDTILEARSFKLSDSRDLLGTDRFTGTTTDYVRRRLAALQDVSLEVEGLAEVADLATLDAAKDAGTPVVTEVFFGDASHPRFRGICLIESIDRDTSMDGLVTTNISFKISATKHVANADGGSGFIAGVAYKTLT